MRALTLRLLAAVGVLLSTGAVAEAPMIKPTPAQKKQAQDYVKSKQPTKHDPQACFQRCMADPKRYGCFTQAGIVPAGVGPSACCKTKCGA